MISVLIRLARAVLENVLAQMNQQLNIVREQALAPIKAMAQQITGGVWIGEGANAFVDEVMSIVIPGVGRVDDDIVSMSTNIQKAREIVENADQEVDQLVKSRLYDAFEFYTG